MAAIVTLKTDPRDTGLVYVCTTPDLAPVMGGFGPARFVGHNPPVPGASYVVGVDDLPRFRVYCVNRSVHIADTRETATPRVRPPWAERPLPECHQCGQPAARGTRPSFCPNCGEPWDAVEVAPAAARHEVIVARCGSCNRDTPAAFSHCTLCGAPLA